MSTTSSTFGGNEVREHREGPVARAIEERTAKLPSDVFLWAAGISVVGSLALQVIGMRRRREMSSFASMGSPMANFVGQWAPTLLLLGIYNKIVKVAGSDRMSRDYEE